MKGLFKVLVFSVCLLPAAYLFHLVYAAYHGENLLGPDPAKALELLTGEWAIRFLILALAVSPARYLLNKPVLWQYRRMVGLYALFYVFLHFLVFLAFLLQWQWSQLGQEISERPYITIGFSAFVLLLPLGATSFQLAQRKLGRRWKQLHRLVYAVAILAVMHLIWIVRSSYEDAVVYGGLVALLLGYRILRHYSKRVRRFTIL